MLQCFTPPPRREILQQAFSSLHTPHCVLKEKLVLHEFTPDQQQAKCLRNMPLHQVDDIYEDSCAKFSC